MSDPLNNQQEVSSQQYSANMLARINFQAKISGNHKVIISLDRLGCPMPGVQGAMQIKEALSEISEWAKKIPSEEKKFLAGIINEHIKKAVSIMNEQKKEKQSIDDEGDS